MDYKFYIIGDTNDGDFAVYKKTVNQKEIDELFKYINDYIDDNGEFINRQEYKNDWAQDCDNPELAEASDTEARMSLFEVIGRFIPYCEFFAHTISEIGVVVDSEEDFATFKESRKMADLILATLTTDKMQTYIREERNDRI